MIKRSRPADLHHVLIPVVPEVAIGYRNSEQSPFCEIREAIACGDDAFLESQVLPNVFSQEVSDGTWREVPPPRVRVDDIQLILLS